MDEQVSKEIIKVLESRGALTACPSCRNTNMNVLDGYFIHPIYLNMIVKENEIPDSIIPTVIMICSNCGNIRQFAAGVLGFVIEQKESKIQSILDQSGKPIQAKLN